MTTDLPYRPNVCMLLINAENQIFLGERMGEPGIWQFPQGGAEPELSLEENVLKELEEETGADKNLFQIIKRLNSVNEYDFDVTPDYAKEKWRGQSQTFWLVKFLGKDSDFNLSKHEPEFMSFCWCGSEKLSEKVEPKRFKSYINPLSELKTFLDSLA